MGPEPIRMNDWVQYVSPVLGGGAEVMTAPTVGPPQAASETDTTRPASVLTPPPAEFWNGSGMSSFS